MPPTRRADEDVGTLTNRPYRTKDLFLRLDGPTNCPDATHYQLTQRDLEEGTGSMENDSVTSTKSSASFWFIAPVGYCLFPPNGASSLMPGQDT